MSEVLATKVSEGMLRTTEGYFRGLEHAEGLFAATQAFDQSIVGSKQVRIIEGHFMYEVIVESEVGKPVSKLVSLAEGILWSEVLGAIPDEMNQFNYQGHLFGFSERYNQLLVEKHTSTLERLGITGTMSAVAVN